jgi:hypothetical protein
MYPLIRLEVSTRMIVAERIIASKSKIPFNVPGVLPRKGML